MAQSSPLAERERWQLVNTRLRDEAREADMDTKLTQLASLMASVDDFGWRDALSDDTEVWQLWARLRGLGQLPPSAEAKASSEK
jgi:hypothetical protein